MWGPWGRGALAPVLCMVLATGCMDRGVGEPLPPDIEREGRLPPPVQDTCDRCPDGTICFEGVCVGQGMLRISLAFSTDSDFDLHVRTPLGSEIYFARSMADGGFLDVDTCIVSCGTGTHVENVFFEESPPAGTYEVWVVNYDGRDAGSFEIDVSVFDDMPFASGDLPDTLGAESDVFTFEYE